MTTAATSVAQASAATALANSTSSSSGNGTSSTNFDSTFSTFLTLLTTQLQNQDPLQPEDTSQFTNQLTAMTGVEQQIKTNATLTQLLSTQEQSNVGSAISYIGKAVDVNGTQFSLQNGSGSFSYNLPSAASAVQIVVSDSKGNPVATLTGPMTAGPNSVTWNGAEDNGNRAPDGTYSISVQALDTNKQPMTVPTTYTGTVTGVTTQDGSPVLQLGTATVSLADVTGVHMPASS